MRVRLIRVVGHRCTANIHWGACLKGGNHGAKADLGPNDLSFKDVADDAWPKKCDGCGEATPTSAMARSIGFGPIYDTPSGEPEVGDVYLSACNESRCKWTNCDGKHCTMTKDTLHRCWVVHGDGANLHVDKAGLTCHAGAGSIQSGGFHGFLHNGNLA